MSAAHRCGLERDSKEALKMRPKASKSQESEDESDNNGIHAASSSYDAMLDAKDKGLAECVTIGQRQWIELVFSYVECCYDADLKDELLVNARRSNKPIMTAAPGGCGKSWLVSKLKALINITAPCGALQGWLQKAQKSGKRCRMLEQS